MRTHKVLNGKIRIGNSIAYYKDGLLHREDGPAIEWSNGTKEWYVNGLLHRANGPAIEYIDGRKSWYLNYKKLSCSSQEEFEQLIKLKEFW